jgi:type II secretory pathway pseudopilin PulG
MVEVIVVCAIIGIAAGIAVPSFSAMVKKMQIRDYVRSAQGTEDAIMSLTGLQYANTTSGNPFFMSWPGNTNEQDLASKEYVTIEQGQTYDWGGVACFRLAPANLASENRNHQSSEGLAEFYKRTMNDLLPVPWKTGNEKNLTCSIYFALTDSDVNSGIAGVAAGKYVRYSFAYSEYFTTVNGKNFVIYHGAKWHSSSAKPGDNAGNAFSSGSPSQDPGVWNVYEIEKSDGTRIFYGAI